MSTTAAGHGIEALPASRGVPSTGAGTGGWRLTRRGRRLVRLLVLGVLAAVVALAATLLPGAVPAPGATEAVAGDGRAAIAADGWTEVVVAPGDTLWHLADRHLPDRDPREGVRDIERANGLEPGALLPSGTRLVVPGT